MGSRVCVAGVRFLLLSECAVSGCHRDWNVEVVNSSSIVLTLTSSGLNAAVDSAIEVASEVIRKRIDEMGTKEPTIIRQGANRIVVQVPGLQNPEALKSLL